MTLTKAKAPTLTCLTCKGDGSYETRHPQWGSRYCPEAYVLVECDDCEGEGTLPYDRETILRAVYEILNDKHEQPYEDVAEAIVARLEEYDALGGC